MRRRAVVLALGLLGLLGLPARGLADDEGPEPLSARTWKRVLRHVLPDGDERAWAEIGWHATFWDAVVEAQREDKPILLWAMNGHALACT